MLNTFHQNLSSDHISQVLVILNWRSVCTTCSSQIDRLIKEISKYTNFHQEAKVLQHFPFKHLKLIWTLFLAQRIKDNKLEFICKPASNPFPQTLHWEEEREKLYILQPCHLWSTHHDSLADKEMDRPAIPYQHHCTWHYSQAPKCVVGVVVSGMWSWRIPKKWMQSFSFHTGNEFG